VEREAELCPLLRCFRYSNVLRVGRPGFDSKQRHEIFPFSTSSRPTHPASYLSGTAGLSAGVKWPEREADHLPPCNAEVKNGGAMPLLPHTSE
jgi:hypothetical protein